MNYILTGKKCTFCPTIAAYIKEKLPNESVVCLNPSEIEYYNKNNLIIYVKAPMSYAWDYYMSDDVYNYNNRMLFNDEIMEFRQIDRFDIEYELNTPIGWRDIADRIIQYITEYNKIKENNRHYDFTKD